MGHLRSEDKMKRCSFKGILADAINVNVSSCGHKLLWWFYSAPNKSKFLTIKLNKLVVRQKQNVKHILLQV